MTPSPLVVRTVPKRVIPKYRSIGKTKNVLSSGEMNGSPTPPERSF
jgi:hypothetical protein